MTRWWLLCMTIVFQLAGQYCAGQTPDSLKIEKIDISKISGTYNGCFRYDDTRGFALIIKKKNKYKTIMTAPRLIISKGTLEIHNDTLVCYETHCNANINYQEKRVKGKPVKFKFIIVGGKLYSIVEKQRILFPMITKN